MTPPVAPSPSRARLRRAGAAFWDWLKSLGGALIVFLVLRAFVLEGFHIPSSSMERTLLVGDWLFVNKALYGAEVPFLHRRLPAVREPARGDIVVFDSKEEPETKVVKRLICLPGDTLEMRDSRLLRNGALVPEPYIIRGDSLQRQSPFRARMREWQLPNVVGRDTAAYAPDPQNWGPLVVPPESLFVMGDNRGNSYDSRYWGFLPRLSLRGSPLFIYYSYDAGSMRPLAFLTSIRWARIFSGPD